jgi:PAS domain S-box-containing protein
MSARGQSMPSPPGESGPVFKVRETEILTTDAPQLYRQKLARVALDEMYQFVAVLDAKGTLLEVNRAALEGAGLQLADVEGKPFWNCFWWAVSKEIQETLRSAVWRASQGEFIRYDVEVYGRAHGKETIIIDFSMIPVKDEAGNVVFIVPEGRDITEKKAYELEIAQKNSDLQSMLLNLNSSKKELFEANKKLAQMNEELERRVEKRTEELAAARDEAVRANELKSQFVANISHEIRTPMSGILGLSEVLTRETEGDARQTVQHLHNSAVNLMSLVNDLLDLSKLEAGRIEIADEVFQIDQLVDDVQSAFYILAKNKGLKLTHDIDQSLASGVHGDVTRIRQVLQNLLQNAIKFTDAGTIAIDVGLQIQDQGKSFIRFSVHDTGLGISAANQKKLFQLFVQLDGSTTRKHGGTGLGLALSKKLVELMGGTIGVESNGTDGSTFWFTVPLKLSDVK